VEALKLKQKYIMSTGKIILGTLAGITLGAIAGVLFAPEKGSTTRKQIKDKGDGYIDDLHSKLDEFSNSLAGKLETTGKGTNKSAENLAKKVY